MVGPARPARELASELGRSAAVVAVVTHVIAAVDAIGAGVLWWTIPAAGFLLLAFFAPLLIASALTRIAARSWWPAAGSGPDPRRAAAVLYAGAATAAAAGLTYNAALVTRKMTSASVAAAGATAVAAVAIAGVLAGIAPLVCRPLGRGLAALEPKLGRLAAPLLSRRGVMTWVGVALVAAGYVFYARILSPRLDGIAFPWMPPLALGAALIIAGHAALPRRLGALAGAVIAAVSIASVSCALVVRSSSPRVMLDLWVGTDASSEAVGALFDLEPLHEAYGVEAPPRRPGAEPRDVVLITVDTWRADRTPPFGSGALVPRFSAFARTAVRFDNALAPSNNTRRSITSMMIGAQPSRVRGRVKGWALALDPRHTLVAERFRSAGYDTVGFFCCRSLFDPERGTGFARGVDRKVYVKSDGELADEAAAFLEKTLAVPPGADRPPVFVWVHLLGPHGWYRGSAKLAQTIARRRYDRALGRIDEPLGALIDAVGEARDRTVLVLTSDHGEGLSDHDAVRHSQGLYQSQLRVPLVISAPGLTPRSIAEPVSLIHLAPTLLDLAGFAPPGPPEMDPGSLAPIARGTPGDGVAYAEQITDRSVPEALWAVVAEGHKLIAGDDGVELYDLAADPNELTDLAAGKPALVERLEAILEERQSRRAQPAW